MGPRNAQCYYELVANIATLRGFVNHLHTFCRNAYTAYFNNGGTICYVWNIASSLAPRGHPGAGERREG